MADLLPSSPDLEATESEPRVLGVDSDDADDVLGALSSATARELLVALHDEPAPPSRLAETVDTSLQNVQYHLEKLQDADLVEKRGTQYSEKGREMTVYGPTDAPLVLFAGDEEEAGGLRSALSRFLGGVGVLGLASLAVQQVVGDGVVPSMGAGGADGASGDAATDGGGQIGTASVETARTASEGAAGLPPGVLFFLGGLLVLCCVAGWWYWRK
jgi:DNA-binding transcriptional ArsR family regulator